MEINSQFSETGEFNNPLFSPYAIFKPFYLHILPKLSKNVKIQAPKKVDCDFFYRAKRGV